MLHNMLYLSSMGIQAELVKSQSNFHRVSEGLEINMRGEEVWRHQEWFRIFAHYRSNKGQPSFKVNVSCEFYPSLHHSVPHKLPFNSTSPSLQCLLPSAGGAGGPQGIDMACLSAVRLIGGMWFTDEFSAMVPLASQFYCTPAHTFRATYLCTFTCWHAELTEINKAQACSNS